MMESWLSAEEQRFDEFVVAIKIERGTPQNIMLSEITHYIYCLPISTVIFFMLLITPAFGVGISFLKRKWPKQNQIACKFISVLYIFLILCLTVLSRECGTKETAELMPFSVFIRAKEQPELYREVLMNIFLFWPLGLFLPQALERLPQDSVKSSQRIGRLPHELGKHPVLTTIIFACILSVSIETLQYIFALGLVETDDVIANTVGTVIGSISFLI